MAEGLLATGEELTGEVRWVVHADSRTGFGVVELVADGGDEVRCAGPLAGLVPGQTIRFVGAWRDHPRHGPTFEVTFYEQVLPRTTAGLRAFLQSDRFPGIGPKTVDRIITTFGVQAGWVIERAPERLVSEAGLSQAQADVLRTRWVEGQAFAELVRLAEPAGWPFEVVRAVFARFAASSAAVAREDPYALLDVDRCRFAHADALAHHLGVDPADPRRLSAAARAAHGAARRSHGHQYLTRAQCAAAAAQLLGADPVVGAAAVDEAVARGVLTVEHVPAGGDDAVEAVYSRGGLAAERGLAEDLARVLTTERSRLVPHADRVSPAVELTDGQAAAVRLAFRSPLSVLTGGPGTGKTRTVEEIVAAAESAGLTVALCAPTGRAAKRMEEIVGHPASTVHRLLDARVLAGGGFAFRYGRDERLPHDLVVCDEVSMCDTSLAASLVAAVDDGAHLVLVGDADQLPPVGPGDVLRDLLRVAVVPSIVLTEIHRQAAQSRIVGLARELNEGEVGRLAPVDGDVYLAEERVRERIVPRVVEAVARRIPDRLGVVPEGVQVVAPVYRGEAGVDELNRALKEALNPDAGRPGVAGFQEGDRVMQTRNDAELDVSNGDVGRVVDLAPGEGTLRVAFPRGEVTYGADQARDLTYAWAVTVHKSQGGEWPVVVFVCDRSHRAMLWRNLAYTAITRAQRALVIVGQAAALRAAARQDRPRNRQTLLGPRLEAALA